MISQDSQLLTRPGSVVDEEKKTKQKSAPAVRGRKSHTIGALLIVYRNIEKFYIKKVSNHFFPEKNFSRVKIFSKKKENKNKFPKNIKATKKRNNIEITIISLHTIRNNLQVKGRREQEIIVGFLLAREAVSFGFCTEELKKRRKTSEEE